jgi:hypothetical protein
MKAFFINPFTETITEISLPDAHNEKARQKRLELMQSFVGGYIERLPWYVRPDFYLCQQNDCYVDEEGLFKNYNKGFCFPEWYANPVKGCAIFVGHDGKGKSCDSTADLIQLKSAIKYVQFEVEQ